jgi:NTP pyrophosphatase (non-canonical NTP hydrolase)
MSKAKEFRAKEPQAHIFFRLSVITYELGDLHKDIVFMHRFPKEKEAHKANAKLSLADMLVQIFLLCDELGFDVEELIELGWKHLEEKYKEYERRGWVEIV